MNGKNGTQLTVLKAKEVRISPNFSNHRKYLSLLAKKIRFGNHDIVETNIIFPQ
jgi:hypothetical protein